MIILRFVKPRGWTSGGEWQLLSRGRQQLPIKLTVLKQRDGKILYQPTRRCDTIIADDIVIRIGELILEAIGDNKLPEKPISVYLKDDSEIYRLLQN